MSINEDTPHPTEDNQCLFCEAESNLEEHHVVPQKFGGSDDPENLITVCSTCHKKIERTWNRRFYEHIGARADMTPNMMLDALKELRFTLMQLRTGIGSMYKLYDQEHQHAGDVTVDDYGGSVTRRQALAIQRELCHNILKGDVVPHIPTAAEIKELEEYSYRVFEEADNDTD